MCRYPIATLSIESRIIERSDDTLINLRLVRGIGDADLLCAGGAEPMVHSGVCRGLRAGIGIWILAGSVAVRSGRGSVVGGCCATLGGFGSLEVVAT